MNQPHRAQHQQSAGEFYAETQRQLAGNARHLGSEDWDEARDGIGQQTQDMASVYSVTQGHALLQGQTTRTDFPTPEQHYPGMAHEELYRMAHDNLDLEQINRYSEVTNQFGNWLADVSNAFADAGSGAQTQWQGEAASGAHGFFQSTASHAEQASNAVQLTSNRYSQQSSAAHYAKTNMPEPTGFNQDAEMNKAVQQFVTGDHAAATETMSGITAKQQQADEAHGRAVQVMQNLDTTYHETASTQPTYTPPPQPGNDSTTASSAHATGFSGTGTTSGVGPGTGTPGGGQFTGSSTPYTGGGGSSYSPPPRLTTGTGNPNLPPVGGPGTRPPMTMPPGTRPGDFGLAGAPPVNPGGKGGDITRSKPGTGSGRAGSNFAGSRVSGGGYSPGKGEQAVGKGSGGSGSGKPAGERLERGATAAANAGKAGKAGAPGAAGGQGAGKKKEEDKEHKNKMPLQDDEVFEVKPDRGPDGEKIVPPVIGG
ncbi:hypothetical protein [Amycolatopsis sp. NPDC058986]|uniref:hypothetical protein n=1 Tax=unclassified Amycolatopsis TaxID=2618356 RepID=UPI00366C5B5D